MSRILRAITLFAFASLALASSLEDDAHKQALREANVKFTYEFEQCSKLPEAQRAKCRGIAKREHTKAVERADAKRRSK